ncbi:MAG TPA: homocysteine S-methyltransferase family protein [Burkholderiales bacterium]|nr:homocysteine S-methyltransferase family protein [Burkholderiales bacterium]
MSKYRRRLQPLLEDRLFMSDGGLETTLIFHQGIDLPEGAAFHLLKDEAGTEVLRRYYALYAGMAREHGLGFVLESPTWRANPDWAAKIGYDARSLAGANRRGIGLMLEIRAAWEKPGLPFVISGNIGPRGDGYFPDRRMSAAEAKRYHAAQVETFAGTDADLVSAFTLNYSEEAIGVAAAARDCAIPAVISFTVETDGRLPSGETLPDAIARVDDATGGYPAYYMINCAHPTHFTPVLRGNADWLARLKGLRANSSMRSHAELDNSPELDTGDPQRLGEEYRELQALLPHLTVVGGCCGTDHRHVDAICRAIDRQERAAAV